MIAERSCDTDRVPAKLEHTREPNPPVADLDLLAKESEGVRGRRL
jgi:hypothetical protein